jgi:hypothetical protein
LHQDGDDDDAQPRLDIMKKTGASSNTTRRSVSFAEPPSSMPESSEEMRPSGHQHDDNDDELGDDGVGTVRFLHTRY